MTSQLLLFRKSSTIDRSQELVITKPGDQPTSSNTTTTRARKPNANKCKNRKKEPQRGMGVAQLEKLRVQAITEANQIDSLNLQPTQQLHVFDPVNYSSNNNPMLYGAVNNYGVPIINAGANGFMGWDHLQGSVVVKRADANCGLNVHNNGGFGSGQFLVNPYAVGAPVHQVGFPGAVFETSKELSSMPKIMQQQCEASRCDLCFKKKRLNGENIGHKNARIDKFGGTAPLHNADFFGLNSQKNHVDLHGQTGGFGARAAKSAFYANQNHNHNEDVNQVVRFHRKCGSSMGRNVFMEYEFFPGKNGKGTCFKEMEFPSTEASVAAAGIGEASCVTTSDHSASNASNSIDLSLKLSY